MRASKGTTSDNSPYSNYNVGKFSEIDPLIIRHSGRRVKPRNIPGKEGNKFNKVLNICIPA